MIKNIPNIPEGIVNAASSGRLVIFIGVGVSRIIGGPSWREFSLWYLKDLLEKGVIDYYEHEHLKQFEPRKLISICKDIGEEREKAKRPNLRDFLRSDEKLKSKYPIYEKLYSFNAIYITTNYDEHLSILAEEPIPEETSISREAPNAQVQVHKPQAGKVINRTEEFLVSNLTNGNVLYLHGNLDDEDDMIVTTVDYIRHYQRESKLSYFLQEVFKDYTVLFVGYGLEEYEILEFLVSKTSGAKDVIQHYMLWPFFREKKRLLRFQKDYYRKLGIELVPYHIGDHGYEQLAKVVEEWAKQVGPVSRPQRFLDRIKIIDEAIS